MIARTTCCHCKRDLNILLDNFVPKDQVEAMIERAIARHNAEIIAAARKAAERIERGPEG